MELADYSTFVVRLVVALRMRIAAVAERPSETLMGVEHRARMARTETPVASRATAARGFACLIWLMASKGRE